MTTWSRCKTEALDRARGDRSDRAWPYRTFERHAEGAKRNLSKPNLIFKARGNSVPPTFDGLRRTLYHEPRPMTDNSGAAPSASPTARIQTGITGLDEILGGGLTADRLYLLEGTPGTGKTTLVAAVPARRASPGARRALYVTLSETRRRAAGGGRHARLVARRHRALRARQRARPRPRQRAVDPAPVRGRARRDRPRGHRARRRARARPGGVRQPVGAAPAGPEPAALPPPDPGAEAVLRRAATARC